MKLQAIETHYAGHRFRSRLEARWAVFFNHLGIRWEYEPQGYMIGPYFPECPTWVDTRRPYLPDFWLPGHRLWVEVKGSVNNIDNELILDASISHLNWGLPADPHGGVFNDGTRNTRRMLILGQIPPDTKNVVVHALTGFHKGDVGVQDAEFTDAGRVEAYGERGYLGADYGSDNADPKLDLVSPLYFRNLQQHHKVRAAYTAARKARFEHGESG